MNCGKRHGSPVTAQNITKDFADCIEICAFQNNCRSVDYQVITKRCYQSAHHGEPTVITPGFSSAYAIGEPNECGESPRPVPPPACPPPPTCPIPAPPTPPPPSATPDLSCGNQGLGFAAYPNTLPNGKPNSKKDKSYSSFIPARFDDQVPEFTGVAKTIAIVNATSIYGHSPKNYEFTAVNHKGYLYAPVSGNYTFSIPKADGIAILWVGSSAKFNWTRGSASLTQIHPEIPTNVYIATFAAGEYVEVRVVWGNGGDNGNFGLEVTGPGGLAYVQSNKVSSFLLQFSCDDDEGGKAAPRWNDWGNEFEGTPSFF